MKILIAVNDSAGRQKLYNSLSRFGECDLAEDGLEAIRAYMASLKTNCPYELVFLAVEMPIVDGLRTYRAIRIIERAAEIEPGKKAKVVLISYRRYAFRAGSNDRRKQTNSIDSQVFHNETNMK